MRERIRILGTQLHRLPFVLATLLLLGIGFALAPASAQSPPKIFRVGHLAAPGRTPDGAPPRALREALRELGYVEGQNIVYEARFAGLRLEREPQVRFPSVTVARAEVGYGAPCQTPKQGIERMCLRGQHGFAAT